MIKQGEVAFIKTTGEAVFVLEITDPSPKIGDQDTMNVFVRRPIAGQDGIKHVNEAFFLAELESLDDQQARFVQERKAVMEKYGPKADQPETLADSRFGIN